MLSIFENVMPGSPAETIMIFLFATAIGICILLTFILLRRTLRKRYFRRLDQRRQFILDNWDRIVSGEIPPKDWFSDKIDREIVEETLLDRIGEAKVEQIFCLQNLARESGLLDWRIQEVRRRKGWTRRVSISALGRMKLPDGIPALSEALEDPRDETVADAVQALGQVGTPEAAQLIMRQVSPRSQQCTPQTVQIALAQCFRSNPHLLLDEVLKADDFLRPILARVLAEVADKRITGNLLELVKDPLAEVRASAARVLAAARPACALNALSMLAGDREWFVRLRTAAAIGDLQDRHGIPLLVNALCDRNRFVRLKAASALITFRGEEERVMQLAMQTGDRYAVQALVSELERSGRLPEIVNRLALDFGRVATESVLLVALQNGSTHLLADLLLNHPERRVRARLAGILARSGDVSLIEYLGRINMPDLEMRQQRMLRWIISKLRKSGATLYGSQEAIPA